MRDRNEGQDKGPDRDRVESFPFDESALGLPDNTYLVSCCVTSAMWYH